MKVLALFDGISCGMVALERANIDVDAYFASEIEKHPIEISRKNYQDIMQIGDVTKVTGDMVGGIDLLIGGSPCQSFSNAGNKKGFNGKSGLFYEYVRILHEVKPKYFLLENVKMKQEWQKVISDELGVQPVEINSTLVSGQIRKRLYWVGKLNGDIYEQVNIEQPQDKNIYLKDILQDENEIDQKYFLSDTEIDNINRNYGSKGKILDPFGDIGFITKIKSQTLLASMGMGGGNVPVIVVREATKKGYAIAKDGDSIDIAYSKSQTRRGLVGDKAKSMMTSQNTIVYFNDRLRKITPIECERLQTLPDNYTQGVSDTQRYKAIGNGWTVDVISHILKQLH